MNTPAKFRKSQYNQYHLGAVFLFGIATGSAGAAICLLLGGMLLRRAISPGA